MKFCGGTFNRSMWGQWNGWCVDYPAFYIDKRKIPDECPFMNELCFAETQSCRTFCWGYPWRRGIAYEKWQVISIDFPRPLKWFSGYHHATLYSIVLGERESNPRVESFTFQKIYHNVATLCFCSNRYCCMVCHHRPIFDTVNMLAVHRQGKKHAAGMYSRTLCYLYDPCMLVKVVKFLYLWQK